MRDTGEDREADSLSLKAHRVDGKYTIRDLVDIERLRGIFEEFSLATGFTTGFVSYPDLKILIATGWRDVCTKFHRACPESAEHCKESNQYLLGRLKKLKELNIKPCGNGLVDGATPVIIRGKHLASLATGQVLFHKPRMDRFRKQAETYGFDPDEYLDALSKVPVVTEEQLKRVLSFLSGIAVMIAEQGLNHLRIKESAEALEKEINGRMKAEQAVHRQSEALEQSPDGIAIADLDGNLQFVNTAWAQMHGFDDPKCLLGKNLSIFHTEEQMSEEVLPFNRKVKEKGSHKGEVGHKKKDGVTFPTRMSSSILKNNHGEPIGMVGISRDITDEIWFEAQLRQAQKIESVGRLAGGVAHDFNNLLTPIISYTEILMSESSPHDPRQRNLQQVLKAANQAKDLTRQLLAFSRKQMLDMTTVDLDETVSHLEKILRRTIRENIEIETRLAGSLDPIRADVSQIEQILMNLAVNAQDAMPDGGRMIIETANVLVDETRPEVLSGLLRPGPHVMLTVSDTGTGMDDQTIKQVFEPFFTTKEPGKGTGLGLATVHGIVKQHEGNISASSELGRGTVFRICFPQATEVARATPPELLPPQRVFSGSETILVVEDDKAVCEFVCILLE